MNGQTMRKQMRKEPPEVDQFDIPRLLYVGYARKGAALLARTGIRYLYVGIRIRTVERHIRSLSYGSASRCGSHS